MVKFYDFWKNYFSVNFNLTFKDILVQKHEIGWGYKLFRPIETNFKAIAKNHNIKRATTSNPDLGLISYNKTFNIVDIGYLGDPFIRVKNHQLLYKFYLNEFPIDIIETHNLLELSFYFYK